MTIEEILKTYKSIAVYGMSANHAKAAHRVPAFMKTVGYNIIPINPVNDEILGMKVYKKLSEVEENIEILNVFRPSEVADDIVLEAIERHKKNGDIKVIWFQEGIFSQNGKKLADENGILYIENKCMYKEYISLP